MASSDPSPFSVRARDDFAAVFFPTSFFLAAFFVMKLFYEATFQVFRRREAKNPPGGPVEPKNGHFLEKIALPILHVVLGRGIRSGIGLAVGAGRPEVEIGIHIVDITAAIAPEA